jgi:hypothetical protein
MGLSQGFFDLPALDHHLLRLVSGLFRRLGFNPADLTLVDPVRL